MPQRHLDRLTPVDASFLHQESANAHMQIGAVIVLEPPAPSLADLLEHVRSRLHLVPRYRQRLAYTALDRGRPVWVDDPGFNLDYHIRHTALPAPSTWAQLQELTARIFSQPLDRQKPLWELWLIEGLDGGGAALVSKTHHSLIDGIAGVDIGTVLFDPSPSPPPVRHVRGPWKPQAEPGKARLVAAALRGAVRAEARLAAGMLDALARPAVALQRAREAAEGLGEVAWAVLNPAPATPLNVQIGPYRRLVAVQSRLEELKAVKDALGGTVNDVVLAVVTGALRSFLLSRGVRTEGLELRALVPVSVRSAGEHGVGGNRIVAIRGPLPLYIADPLERLRFIRTAMSGLKESKQALGAKVIADAQSLAPPTLLAQASRLNFSTRLFNLVVTNVPGPQYPLYVLGRRLLHVYPVAFLPENHGLAIAVMSYNGEMNFSLLADFDALPDVERIGEALSAELATLLDLAAHRRADTPAPDSRAATPAPGSAVAAAAVGIADAGKLAGARPSRAHAPRHPASAEQSANGAPASTVASVAPARLSRAPKASGRVPAQGPARGRRRRPPERRDGGSGNGRSPTGS